MIYEKYFVLMLLWQTLSVYAMEEGKSFALSRDKTKQWLIDNRQALLKANEVDLKNCYKITGISYLKNRDCLIKFFKEVDYKEIEEHFGNDDRGFNEFMDRFDGPLDESIDIIPEVKTFRRHSTDAKFFRAKW